MKTSYEFQNGNFVEVYELNEKEVDIMKHVSLHEHVYFKELKYGEENPLDSSKTFTYDECMDLIAHDFLDEDSDWMYAYVPTKKGRAYLQMLREQEEK